MDYNKFIEDQIVYIRKAVGKAKAINALSGGVDSSTVTVLGHRAIGDQLKNVFVDNLEPHKWPIDYPKIINDLMVKRRAGELDKSAVLYRVMESFDV